jgi:hypothetical protein
MATGAYPIADNPVTGELTYGSGSGGSMALSSTLTLSKSGQPDVPVDNFGGVCCVSAPLAVVGAGNGLRVAEGSNAKMGTATLNGTTAVVVSTTAVTASSRIFLTINTPGGTPASPYVFARSAGTSFSIKSTGASDTSTVAWLVMEPS